ncbi:tRNA pseudouridine(55) synthase TruB [Eionea flava]
MGRRPKWGRPIDGVLLLNKSTGMTSNDALQQAKRLFFANRAGHTGSLDPLATGVLPICFGEATKFSQYLLDADKRYSSTFRLGVKTETGDCDGSVVGTQDARQITQEQIDACIPRFTGKISQIPSMYSALKHQGKPLYKWAREGVVIPREPRQVTIYDYRVTACRLGCEQVEVDVEVHCSKGTYIRSLAEDLGEMLGVGAHVSRLHRRSAGPFNEEDSISLDALTALRGESEAESLDHLLLPTDSPVQNIPQVSISDEMGDYFRQGQGVMSTQAYRSAEEGGIVRVCSDSGDFLGIAELTEGQLAPKRVVVKR